VTDSFRQEGKARGKNTAMKAGGGAALGAIIGALAGGGKGAAIGAAAGAGAGTGVNAVTHGEQAQIPSETRLEFRLQSPVTVSVTTTPGAARQPYQPNPDPSLQQR
jgi:outer membrane lipoprotein SlyB